METVASKLTKKYQATIPESVRRVLQLKAGDTIAFEIEGDEIYLRKVNPTDVAFHQSLQATLTEWASKADDEAYRDL